MSQSQPTHLTISQVSEVTGVHIHTLRCWEKEFDEFLSPERTAGGHRSYSPSDVETVFQIKRLLRDEMFSIAGAVRHLRLARRMRGLA